MTTPDDVVPGDHLAPDERDPEAPHEDAIEQATPVDPLAEDSALHRGLEVGAAEVNEYDAVEQARIVDVDDDYR
jgi:hypothetical protein